MRWEGPYGGVRICPCPVRSVTSGVTSGAKRNVVCATKYSIPTLKIGMTVLHQRKSAPIDPPWTDVIAHITQKRRRQLIEIGREGNCHLVRAEWLAATRAASVPVVH